MERQPPASRRQPLSFDVHGRVQFQPGDSVSNSTEFVDVDLSNAGSTEHIGAYAVNKGKTSISIRRRDLRVCVSIIVVASVALLLSTGVFWLFAAPSADGGQRADASRFPTEYLRRLPAAQRVWFERGYAELHDAIARDFNKRHARNVILFVGDGMGPNSVTAARIARHQEEGLMAWERFPHMAMLKTYCADRQVPDSMSTATALFGGVKTNYETGGVDDSVLLGNCSASLNASHHVESIVAWAQAAGMRTGFVTNTRVTHATPAALYAHAADRRWECESRMPAAAIQLGCKDIARQLVENEIGQKLNVIMGGGRQMLRSNVKNSSDDPIDTWAGAAEDGRDLINVWHAQKSRMHARAAVVQNSGELAALACGSVDYVLGIFANGHLKYDHERDRSAAGMPSLEQMTLKAIEVLNNCSDSDKGFLLVVEGGLIDQAHHRGTARKAINEVLALEQAVAATVKKLAGKLDETLIIVTADHSHSLTINGYPKKGADIFGIGGVSLTEGTPYTTLTYGTSYKGFQADAAGNRVSPASSGNLSDWDYAQQAAINTNENLHGGSDVTLHARGPMAYLFHGVHEQSYVAHAIAYALRIGRFTNSALVDSLAAGAPS